MIITFFLQLSLRRLLGLIFLCYSTDSPWEVSNYLMVSSTIHRLMSSKSVSPSPTTSLISDPPSQVPAGLLYLEWDAQGTLNLQFSSVQSLSCVQLFATPWIAARQASLSITNSWSLLKLMSIESVMPFSHLIFCHPLLLLPPIPPSIKVFCSESTLRMRWPKYWSFSFSISPSKKHPGQISFRMDSLQSRGLSRVFSNTIVQKHQFLGAQLSSQSNSHIHTWPLEKP